MRMGFVAERPEHIVQRRKHALRRQGKDKKDHPDKRPVFSVGHALDNGLDGLLHTSPLFW
jgi:hypothetical protein